MNIWIIKTCDVKLDGTVKTLQDGTLLDLPDDKAQRLIDAGYAGKYTHSGDGRDLSHFCFDGDCHCSAKLPGADFPAGCIKCDNYHASLDVPQATNEVQGIQAAA